jgi:hypothetical protein
MGIRSDVFVAIHRDLWGKVEHLSIWGDADSHNTEDGHHGFLFTDIKWYRCEDQHIAELYRLIDNDPALHWIVEACPEYPESSDGDSGEWSNNPWGGHRVVSVSIDCGLSDVVGSGLESDSALDND